MELQGIIFPSPKPGYNLQNFNYTNQRRKHIENNDFFKYEERDSLIFVSSYYYQNKEQRHSVPCTFLPYFDDENYSTNQFIIYFHGNAEDIGYSYDFQTTLRDEFCMNVIAMEYPGYGIYTQYQPSEEQILTDAQNVYDYVKSLTEEYNIFVFGRSMGSGSATYLAGQNPTIGGLILMSAYTSIQQAAESLVSKFISWLVKDRFRNIDHIKKVKCPTLLIHGKSDDLISWKHSQELYDNIKENIKNNNMVSTHFSQEMTHNDYNPQKDIIEPLEYFFNNIINQKSQQSRDKKWDFRKYKIDYFMKHFDCKPVPYHRNSHHQNQQWQQQQQQQQQYQQQVIQGQQEQQDIHISNSKTVEESKQYQDMNKYAFKNNQNNNFRQAPNNFYHNMNHNFSDKTIHSKQNNKQ